VGRLTRAQLDNSAQQRVQQIELNLERQRWLPEPPRRMHIEVWIPAFELSLFDGGSEVLHSRVIGGRKSWPTPVFEATTTAVVLSPYWNVPPRIAALEVLPAVRRDPSYLARNDMRVVTSRGTVLDARNIDWNATRGKTFPYSFRQEPGPDNPLGGIKLLLPNPYDVYLHDTPARSLFEQPLRALSHGCVRVERAFDLAAAVMRTLKGWTEDSIRAGIAARVPREIPLPQPVPVAIRYRTAWVEQSRTIHFRDDLYGHDARLAAALAENRAPRVHMLPVLAHKDSPVRDVCSTAQD
jgi:murein L,D-transpeptidase YcbB/YkuD